jgi:hypothetical protein
MIFFSNACIIVAEVLVYVLGSQIHILVVFLTNSQSLLVFLDDLLIVLLNDGVVHFAENVTVLDEVQLIQLQG